MFGAFAGGVYATFDRLSPWSLLTVGKHFAAAPNCTAARWVGLAPAKRGTPGYYRRHDRDRDGIACEPFTAR
ncbi:excalibur calcium-binding domain-containing protein [Fodinicurvata fenggangensis]|uniref:excalibur calcium-binding domain-containing protein n=1 Tax=Fodinicurvata fenggangensis TaxID=1121830 RepID=UPI0012DCA0E7